jgi:hypothetical protein
MGSVWLVYGDLLAAGNRYAGGWLWISDSKWGAHITFGAFDVCTRKEEEIKVSDRFTDRRL